MAKPRTPEEDNQVQLQPGDIVCYEVDGVGGAAVFTGRLDVITSSSPLGKALLEQHIELGKPIRFQTGSGQRIEAHDAVIKNVSRDPSRVSCLPDSLAV